MKHIRILDPLRGLAALGVVLFHYSGSMLPTVRPSMLEDLFAPGKWGVQVFFVISGFIIPYAMVRRRYTWNDMGRFMARRYVRIAPPAYVAALMVVLFHAAALWINGRPVNTGDWPGINVRSVAGNLVFHPTLLGSEWYNFAYWTLMIEFQFYAFIALVLPLLVAPNRTARTVTIMAFSLAMSLVDTQWFFHHAPFFMMGTLVFLHQHGTIGRRVYVALLVAIIVLLSFRWNWVPILFAAVTTWLIHARLDVGTAATDLLGRISYSLYIVHVPFGYIAETGLKRLITLHELEWGRIVLVFVYTAITLLGAWVFHLVVERPFLRLSQDIGKQRPGPAGG